MALRRRTAGEHLQPRIQLRVQPGPHALQPQCGHAGRCQLDGQRQAVELAAQVHCRLQIGIGQLEVRLQRLDARDQQLQRRVGAGQRGQDGLV